MNRRVAIALDEDTAQRLIRYAQKKDWSFSKTAANLIRMALDMEEQRESQ